MNILKIKRALAELVWTGALLLPQPACSFARGRRRAAYCAAERMLRSSSPRCFPSGAFPSAVEAVPQARSACCCVLYPLLGLRPKAPAAMLCGVLGALPAAQRRWMFWPQAESSLSPLLLVCHWL
ncbi:MAG: hypothetical protein ACLR7U_09575 [Ruthenibacterium lactatiformans]